MKENENKDEAFTPLPEQLAAMFARDNAKAMAQLDAKERAEAWPGEVEQILAALAKRSKVQADALGAIHQRLAVVEAAMGISEG